MKALGSFWATPQSFCLPSSAHHLEPGPASKLTGAPWCHGKGAGGSREPGFESWLAPTSGVTVGRSTKHFSLGFFTCERETIAGQPTS